MRIVGTFAVTFAVAFALAGCGVGAIASPTEPLGDDDDNSRNGSTATTPESKDNKSSAPAPLQDVPGTDNPSQAPSTDDVPETVPPANEPATAISPFHPSGALTYQRPIIWTISAFDSITPIHYTTNGSAPTSMSQTAIGKVSLSDLSEGTRIRWVAATSNVIHEVVVHVDSNLATATHHIVENVRFTASGGPVVRVKPGASVTGKAGAAVWNGEATCPTCIDQITLGITKAATCLVNVQPNTFPGSAGADMSFTITAPMNLGVYKMKTGFTQQYKCSDAIGQPLQETEVGTIIVE